MSIKITAFLRITCKNLCNCWILH